MPAGTTLQARSAEVEARLRGRSSGLRAAIQPLVELQNNLLQQAPALGVTPRDVTLALLAIQEKILSTLADRYDALDSAARDSELPFAELDHTGRIVYANDAMGQQIPQPLGRDFASLFGVRAAHVADAIAGGRCESLRVELECQGLPRQFRAEIGPLRDHEGRPGAYALLLGLRAEELRLDAALDGIIRTDLTGRIAFANNKALELLHLQREQVLGSELSSWLAPRTLGSGLPVPQRIHKWLTATGAVSDDDLTLTGGGQSHPISAAVVPNYDSPERRAGILMTFRDVGEELAREALRGLLMSDKEPLAVVREALHIVGRVVPYDMATFSTYSDDVRYCRAQLVDPEPTWYWGTRWFDVTPDGVKWLQDGQMWSDDLQGLVSRLSPDLLEDPVWKAVQRDKLNHMVVLPVRGAGGTFRCVLSLLAKNRKFGAEDARVLRDLGLEEVLLAAQIATERRQEACIRKLKEGLNKAENAHMLARTLAQGVVTCFGWEYAGVFRVNRKDRMFELFEQIDNSAGRSLKIEGPYRQKLTDGMLGHCYRHGKVLVLPRVRSDGHNFNFIKTAEAQKSAMTVPLRVNGRIELILDLEASQENAFAGPDKQLAEALVADCEQILENRWHEAIKNSLMDAIDQAAVIVDNSGAIRQVNAAARQILAAPRDVALKTFGADEADRQWLVAGDTIEPTRVTLSPQSGVRIPTLAFQQPLNDDYGHRLWLFSNLLGQQWERDDAYLEQTVSEVARQARAPLMIADGLLRGAAGLLRNRGLVAECANLLERAANQLQKADMTYDRLSDSLNAKTTPTEPSRSFEVIELLREIIGRLPHDDVASIEAQLPQEQGFVIDGWPERLAYALRSVLGFLLLSGSNKPVVVKAELTEAGTLRIEMAGHRTEVTMAATPSGDADSDPITASEEQARQAVALAPQAVESAITLHRGTLKMPDPEDEQAVFVIDLQRSPEAHP
jgi:PAS domain-containing protein